jgi:hypothetical protein
LLIVFDRLIAIEVGECGGGESFGSQIEIRTPRIEDVLSILNANFDHNLLLSFGWIPPFDGSPRWLTNQNCISSLAYES